MFSTSASVLRLAFQSDTIYPMSYPRPVIFAFYLFTADINIFRRIQYKNKTQVKVKFTVMIQIVCTICPAIAYFTSRKCFESYTFTLRWLTKRGTRINRLWWQAGWPTLFRELRRGPVLTIRVNYTRKMCRVDLENKNQLECTWGTAEKGTKYWH